VRGAAWCWRLGRQSTRRECVAARRRGIAAVIVMPQTTPHIKVQA